MVININTTETYFFNIHIAAECTCWRWWIVQSSGVVLYSSGGRRDHALCLSSCQEGFAALQLAPTDKQRPNLLSCVQVQLIAVQTRPSMSCIDSHDNVCVPSLELCPAQTTRYKVYPLASPIQAPQQPFNEVFGSFLAPNPIYGTRRSMRFESRKSILARFVTHFWCLLGWGLHTARVGANLSCVHQAHLLQSQMKGTRAGFSF